MAMAVGGEALGAGAAAAGAAGAAGLSDAIGKLTGVFNGMQGSLSRLSGPLQEVTSTFGRLGGIIQETVGLFNPVVLLQFNRAMMDLKAVFGSIFRPVLIEMTSIIRKLADYFYNLSPTFKNLIAQLARTSVLTGLFTTVVGLFITLGSTMAMVAAVVQPIIYAFNQVRKSSEGMAGLTKIWDLIESSFTAFMEVVQTAWSSTAGVRAQLGAALGKLGAALGELFEVLRPLFALHYAAVGAILSGLIQVISDVIMNIAKGLTFLARKLTEFLRPLMGVLRDFGFKLPEVNKSTGKSSQGLGYGGVTVTDAASLYNKLTEQIGMGARRDPQEEVAANTSELVALLGSINGSLDGLIVVLTEGITGGLQGVLDAHIQTARMLNPVVALSKLVNG